MITPLNLDMHLFGEMVDQRFGRDMHELLAQDGLTITSAKNQEIPIDIEPPMFFMSVKVDRPLDTLIEMVRKHVPRGVMIDFYFTLVGQEDETQVRINAEPMPGLL